jgi:hypothetical protein
MRPSNQEMTLRSALSDPLIRTLMAADKVDPEKLETMLTRIAQQTAPRSMERTAPSVWPTMKTLCGCGA